MNEAPTTEKRTKMDPKLRTRWLEALRSGKYTQARGTLRDVAGNMCCLGVVCDLIDPTKWNDTPSEHDGTKGFGWNGDSPAYIKTPASAAGLTLLQATKLAQLNDGHDGQRKCSFAEIADFIEANL